MTENKLLNIVKWVEEADECPSCFFYDDGYCWEYDEKCIDVDECHYFIGGDE